jgi:serine/threonine-protein kinase
MDNDSSSIPTITEPDANLSVFYKMAEKEIPPQERSMLYNEVRTIEQRYCEHQEIASGGLKRIHRVYDRKSGRHVAYACLREPQRKELVEPFLREARLTGSLHHPNIIPIYDLGLDENEDPYFIMELKSGKTLARILKDHHKGTSKAWTTDALLGIFLKVCEAMAYAHSRHILHLDLKPENIQVGEFGEVIICDWGLAKIISTAEDVTTDYMEPASNPDLVNPITLSGHVKGTPGYMAPEQVSSGEKKTYTTDVYGLGAMLYCILTGKAPIDGEVKEVLEKTRNGQIVPPSEINPAVSSALSAVAMKALRLDAERRYQCVEDLTTDIQKYTAGFATSAENAGLLKLLQLLYMRHRLFFISSAMVLAVFVAMSCIYLYHLSESRKMAVQERNRAQAALEKIVEEEKVIASLRGNIEQTSLESSNLFWKEPLQTAQKTRAAFNTAMAELDRALEQNPTNELAWAKKGFLCFLMQRYNKASECFSHGDVTQTPLTPLSRKYAVLKSDDEFLANEQFAELCAEVMAIGENRIGTVEMMLLYDYTARKGISDHADNVLMVLKLWNSQWMEPVFSYQKRRKQLTIGGDGLRRLALTSHWSSGETLLRTLHLRRLSFDASDYSDFEQLTALPVGALDISRSQITSLDGIQHMRSLVQLTIRKDQFSDAERKRIPPGISVKTVQ